MVKEQTFPSLFLRQASRSPLREAVVSAETTLTYASLDNLADSVAANLSSLGVTPECRVAVRLEHSANLVAAILGVLKTGACVVPIDPTYPIDYQGEILRLSEASIIVTSKKSTSDHFRSAPMSIDIESLTRASQTFSSPPISHADLAFLFFTSGSTGKPKVVKMSHFARLASVLWLQNEFAACSSHLFRSSISHNPMVREIFWPLLSGGRVIVASGESRNDIQRLHALIHNFEVEVVGFTPSLLRLFLNHVSAGDCPSLRYIICGGEPLDSLTQATFFRRLQNSELIRFYGLTEAGMALFRRLQPSDPPSVLGKATYMDVELVDSCLDPVELGSEGELLIIGDGVSDGYLGDSKDSRFVEWKHRPGVRAFRTGDRAVQDSNGDFYFSGRKDRLIKVRGVRVELGEVEQRVEQISGVNSAIAMQVPQTPGRSRLLCFYTSSHGTKRAPDSIRSELVQTVPPAFVPHRLIQLSGIPLAANGKVDFSALRKLALSLPPENKSEKIGVVAEIIRQAIGSTKNQRDGRFYSDLGGDSLAAIEIRAELYRQFGVDVPTAFLNTNFAVSDLEEIILRLQDQSGNATRINKIAGAQIRVPLLRNQVEAMARRGRKIFHACKVTGEFNVSWLDRALSQFEVRHRIGSVRIRVDKSTKTFWQELIDQGDHLEHIKLSGEKNDRVMAAAILQAEFVKEEPLLPYRVLAIEVFHGITHLLFAFDMAFFDGVSVRTFFSEVSDSYAVPHRQDTHRAISEPIRLFDYVEWESRKLTQFDHSSDLQRLYHAPDVTFCRASDAFRKLSTVKSVHSVDVDSRTCLRSITRRLGISTNKLLLGFISLAMAKELGLSSIMLHVLVGNRSTAGTEEVIAPLATRSPLVFYFDSGETHCLQDIRNSTDRIDTYHPPLHFWREKAGDSQVFKSRVLVAFAADGLSQLRFQGCSVTPLSNLWESEAPLDPFTDIFINIRNSGESIHFEVRHIDDKQIAKLANRLIIQIQEAIRRSSDGLSVC